MSLTCPECKNDVDMTLFPTVKREEIVECNMCGITLMITETSGEKFMAEIVDEGK